jgi:hypothetical protein
LPFEIVEVHVATGFQLHLQLRGMAFIIMLTCIFTFVMLELLMMNNPDLYIESLADVSWDHYILMQQLSPLHVN